MTHPAENEADISVLTIPDPYRDGRMPVFLEAMRLLARNYSMLKVGEISGPYTLATNLGGTGVYLDTRRNPQKVRALLEYAEKVITRYGQAMVKAGADLILVAEPTGSQLSAAAYEEFSLPYTRNITRSLSRPCILHICGRAGHLVELMCRAGAAALSIDDVDIAQVINVVPHDIVVTGNISALKFSKPSPEERNTDTATLVEAVRARKEFIVAPGCDLAPQTPLENVLAFVDAVKGNRN